MTATSRRGLRVLRSFLGFALSAPEEAALTTPEAVNRWLIDGCIEAARALPAVRAGEIWLPLVELIRRAEARSPRRPRRRPVSSGAGRRRAR